MARYMLHFANGVQEFACESEIDLTREWVRGKDKHGRVLIVRISEIRMIQEVA